MMMVAVFMISVTPTAKAIQRQNLGFIRKTEIGCRLSHDPQTYQISELKNGNFYTIFVVIVYVEWAKKMVPCKFCDDFWRPILN